MRMLIHYIWDLGDTKLGRQARDDALTISAPGHRSLVVKVKSVHTDVSQKADI